MIVKHLSIYISLIFLLTLSYGLAHLDIGEWQMSLGLLIGVIKATLIGLFFMNLRLNDGLHRVFALAGIFILGALFSLSMADYVSRNWLALPGDFPTAFTP